MDMRTKRYQDPSAVVADINESAPVPFATAVITTDGQDREGDIVLPLGGDLTDFAKYPVVLWQHNEDADGQLKTPVGLDEDPVTGECTVVLKPERAFETCYFHQADLRSAQVCELVMKRVIRGKSISFLPIDSRPNPRSPINPRTGQPKGKIYTKWSLLESSWCYNPVNPDALLIDTVEEILGRDRVAGKSLDPAIRKSLSACLPPGRAWSPGVDLVTKAVRPAKAASNIPDGPSPLPDSVRPAVSTEPVLPETKATLPPDLNRPKVSTEPVLPKAMMEATGADGGDVVDDKPKALPQPSTGDDIQAVIHPGPREAAIAWATRHGFDISSVHETFLGWRFDQFPEAELLDEARRVALTHGVVALVGTRGTDSDQPQAPTLDNTVSEEPPMPQAKSVPAKKDFDNNQVPGTGVVEKKASLESGSGDPENGEVKAMGRMKAGHSFMHAMKALLEEHGPLQDHPEMEKCYKALGKTCIKHCMKAYPDLHKELGWEKDFDDDTSDEEGGHDTKSIPDDDGERDMYDDDENEVKGGKKGVKKDFEDDIADEGTMKAIRDAEELVYKRFGKSSDELEPNDEE